MNFQQTGLPDKPLFHDAFFAGWERYLSLFVHDVKAAAKEYQRGPVATAKMVYEHGGDFHQTAVAACLAGPAVFTENPSWRAPQRLVEFAKEVRRVDSGIRADFYVAVAALSSDARLLLQASAIMLMEQLARDGKVPEDGKPEHHKSYEEAVRLYSAARGASDAYRLDTRFEIAAMKVTTVLEKTPHLWVASKSPAPLVTA